MNKPEPRRRGLLCKWTGIKGYIPIYDDCEGIESRPDDPADLNRLLAAVDAVLAKHDPVQLGSPELAELRLASLPADHPQIKGATTHG